MRDNDEIGQFRSDGPDSMYEGAVFVGPKIKTQRAAIFNIVREFGPLIDHDIWERYKQTQNAGVLLSTIHARRRELVKLNLVGDSGQRGGSPKSSVQCIKWGVSSSISAEQLRRNLLAESTAADALTYAFTRLRTDTDKIEFLGLWFRNDWDMISIMYPDFAQMGTGKDEDSD